MNEQDRSQKKIFEEEQAHLTETHRKLREMRGALEAKVEAISEKAAREKEDIRSNLSLNFDSDTDSMETYIEFEAMSHSIDQYNIEQNAAMEKLGRVKRLLKAPYFARVRLRFDPEEEPEDYYIGSAGVSENAWQQLVIDWRSPIAETYYNQENGRTFYMVNGNRVDVDLQLRRQYDLAEDKLFSFFDTQVAIEDPMLLQSLSSRRTDKMKAITATIQKEQNAVIRCEDVPVLMVNGIAGSGKTSVLLQRIAYLFYRKREESLTTTSDFSKKEKRLNDFNKSIAKLHGISQGLEGDERKALVRRVEQLAMDYTFNTLALYGADDVFNSKTERPLVSSTNIGIPSKWFTRLSSRSHSSRNN